ncbi:MAG: L-serine ammonia-lyase [Mobilicoccus sp.]|nr:L-serine ammonia-lyase [Mobilicoccus sp.]
MTLSVFDLFSVGIGPSSSHTVGPMRAAGRFREALDKGDRLSRVARVRVDLYGSLAATAVGHATDTAVLLGLMGEHPEHVQPRDVAARVMDVRATGRLPLYGATEIAFDYDTDLVLRPLTTLEAHPNGLVFAAFDSGGEKLTERTYFSIGGGFVIDGRRIGSDPAIVDRTPVPHPFLNGEQMLAEHARTGLSVQEMVWENEVSRSTPEQVRSGLLEIWSVMQECVAHGLATEGILPGGLGVRRRAPELLRSLEAQKDSTDPIRGIDWLTLWALAVNEENAAGGRVVTAPTNGAAGIVPSVLHYYVTFVPGANEQGVVDFLLVAGALGILYKENASISGAEVGCQGEVGSACSMAAGALAAVMGGTAMQVENAAEIAMEHNLGLTCDPVGGLVQVPCIERNAVASVKAVTAARTALHGDGTHLVSLDKVIKTMRDTGADMKDKYKETARGGLAVNVVNC